MEISITVACYKAAKEELKDYLPTLFTGKKKPSDLLSLPLFDMDLDSLVTLTKHLKSHKDEAYPKVAKLCRSLKDPKNKRVESVEELGKMLKQFLKEQEYKTLHSLHATLRGVAYLPIEVTFYPRIVETRRDNGRDPYVI